MKKNGLGRGLDALFDDNAFTPETTNETKVVTLPLSSVVPDENQHRKTFSTDSLTELAESIRQHGILQPILVTPLANGKYKIIAGERRFRAASIAALTEVPVLIRDVSAQNAAEMALIENLQREDLNPMEEAGGYDALIRTYGLTQEEAAKRLGKSRVAIANTLRLLSLPAAAQSMVRNKTVSAGHARALLALKDEALIHRILGEIVEKNLSVRETEGLVKRLLEGKTGANAKSPVDKTVSRSYFDALERKVSSRMGRAVAIQSKPKGNGTIRLSFENSDDLEKLLILLCSEDILIDSI